jgi:hypothetical protein
LLPALNRARESSLRAQCASNLRQVGLAYQLYANEQKDYAPLGYINNGSIQKNWNYGANYTFSNGSGPTRTFMMGWLVDARVVKEIKAFYCPAERFEQWVYNGTEITPNPWPFSATDQTRIGYGFRPVVGWVPPATATGAWTFKDSIGKAASLPKWSRMKNLAAATEVMVNQTNLRTRHKQGINVLYGNGAVKWVPKDAFLYQTPSLSGLIQVGGTTPDDNASFNPGFASYFLLDTGSTGKPVVPAKGFWGDLDRF